jgi:hypothetical protein
MDRKGSTRVAVALLIALALAMVSAPAAAADRRGPGGQVLANWVDSAANHGDRLWSRVGSWLVQMAKTLIGETGGETTDASAGLDPTNSVEGATDPRPSATEATDQSSGS